MKFSDVLQQAADSSFVHPEGKKVPATVHAAVYKQSKAGNPMLEVQFKVTGGPNAGKGRPIRTWLVLDNDTTIQQITNMGVRKGELDQLGAYEMEQAGERLAAMLVGKKAAVNIVQETFNDRLQNKITWVNPAQGAAGPQQPQPRKAEPVADATPDSYTEEVAVEPDENPEDELARLERQLAEAKKANGGSRRSPAPDGLPF